jgi:hypothetical protein
MVIPWIANLWRALKVDLLDLRGNTVVRLRDCSTPHEVREKYYHGKAHQNHEVGGTHTEMICKKPERGRNDGAADNRHDHHRRSDLTLLARRGDP